MHAEVADLIHVSNRWLARFESALAGRSDETLESLFHSDSHWRDILALTWCIKTVSGSSAIARALKTHADRVCPTGFSTDPGRTAPRHVQRAGTPTIEAIIRFETPRGHCNGVLRLRPDSNGDNNFKAWTMLTALDELKAREEQVGSMRSAGDGSSRDLAAPDEPGQRKSAAARVDAQPAVLVVGGGQAGLSVAAQLARRRIETLIVDRWPRIGDNWRRRYATLKLHNQLRVNHLPYLPFPPSWPVYIPKDKLAAWFESYAEEMELDYCAGAEFEGGTYDEAEGRWTATLCGANGRKQKLHPRHIVMANGLFGEPNLPDIPSLRQFGAAIMHSSQYDDGARWSSKRVIVIGSGTCGHDIAQDLHTAGAEVTLVQRSPTVIVSIEPSGQLPYRLYEEGPPLEDCDLLAASIPLVLARKTQQIITQKAKELDRELLERLERVGFKLDFGEDGTGWVFKFLTRGGGFYFNVGCSDLIAEGKIGLAQFSDIVEFVEGGARMRDGSTLAADLIVLATGYKGQDHVVRQLFGDEIATRVGPVWGFGNAQDLRNMYTRTAQPGLWFIAGSFAHCRIYSKYIALQIQACEAGLLSPRLEDM